MTRYLIHLDKKAKQGLLAAPAKDRLRIAAALELLRENPIPPRAVKLQGRDGYRVRIGKYRILYTFDGSVLTIYVLDIGPRGDIYK